MDIPWRRVATPRLRRGYSKTVRGEPRARAAPQVRSLALVADGAHTLSDAFAAYVALAAESYDEEPHDERKYRRRADMSLLMNRGDAAAGK